MDGRLCYLNRCGDFINDNVSLELIMGYSKAGWVQRVQFRPGLGLPGRRQLDKVRAADRHQPVISASRASNRYDRCCP